MLIKTERDLIRAIEDAGYSTDSLDTRPIVRRDMVDDYLFLTPERLPDALTRIIDSTGRKGIAFKVKGQNGEPHVITVHQRDPGGNRYVFCTDSAMRRIYFESSTESQVESGVITDLLTRNGPVQLEGELPAKKAESSSLCKKVVIATAIVFAGIAAYFNGHK